MITFNEREYKERKEIAKLIANWLKEYTHEVVVKVLEKREEIINNEFTMNMLKELYKREEEEQKEINNSIQSLLEYFDEHKEFDIHNHCLTHSNSYRDVLYDMYIRD